MRASTKAGIIKKLSKALPWHSCITVYKSFVRSCLDYGDMTNQIMKVLIKKLKEFNVRLLLELQLPLKEHLRVKYITN